MPTLGVALAERRLFVFGYETPKQMAANEANGWDDEDSAALFIDADDVRTAEQWGQAVAQAFFAWLHGDSNASWRDRRYASWIEPDPWSSYDAAQLAAIPKVSCGEYPDWQSLMGWKDNA